MLERMYLESLRRNSYKRKQTPEQILSMRVRKNQHSAKSHLAGYEPHFQEIPYILCSPFDPPKQSRRQDLGNASPTPRTFPGVFDAEELPTKARLTMTQFDPAC